LFWEYGDPASSEERFRSALSSAQGDERLELLTQIARTYGLRQRFEQAHQILNEVEAQLAEAGTRPQIRYLLERGRTHNSSGEGEKARALFVEAWERAQIAAQEGLAVDAAHMVAITYSGRQEALDWNRRGLELARGSEDTKALALIPAMLNNRAWDLHDMGHFAEALPVFEEALAEWRARGKPKQILAAKRAVAQCLQSLGRNTDALAILSELKAEQYPDSVDGYGTEQT